MNDHGEGMQLVVGVLLIICGLVTAFGLLVGVRHLIGAGLDAMRALRR